MGGDELSGCRPLSEKQQQSTIPHGLFCSLTRYPMLVSISQQPCLGAPSQTRPAASHAHHEAERWAQARAPAETAPAVAAKRFAMSVEPKELHSIGSVDQVDRVGSQRPLAVTRVSSAATPEQDGRRVSVSSRIGPSTCCSSVARSRVSSIACSRDVYMHTHEHRAHSNSDTLERRKPAQHQRLFGIPFRGRQRTYPR
jgi:hypothetical protein